MADAHPGIYDSDDVAELRNTLEAAIESFPDYYFVLSAAYDDADLVDFQVEIANYAVCNALGISVEDIRGERLSHLRPFPEKTSVLSSQLRETLRSQRPVDFDLGDSPYETDGATVHRLQARCVPDEDRLFLSVTRVPKTAVTITGPNLDPVDFEKGFEAALIGVALISRETGLIERANELMARILGATGSRNLLGLCLQDLVTDEHRRGYLAAMHRLRQNPNTHQHVRIGVKKDGGQPGVAHLAMTTFGSKQVLVQADDQTRIASAMELSDQSIRDFELLAQSMSDVVVRLDTAGLIEWGSPSAAAVFGLSNRETAGQPFLNFVHGDFARATYAAIAAAASGRDTKDFLIRILQRGADSIWMQGSARPIRTAHGGIGGVVVSLRNVDAEQRAMEKLADLNLLDPLTGLGTREAMVDRLSEELKDPGVRCSILEIHIDHLGRLNEALTFSGGDQVIAAVADRLHRHLGARGDAFRIAGGEFGVILRETETLSQAVVIAERMRTLCGTPLSVGELQVSPSLSVGVAFAQDADTNKLLYDAHRAMRTAKLRGGNQCALTDDRSGLDETRWLVDEAELNDALREGRYVAFFQPIVTLPDEALAGFEVLVRCEQPDGRVILPPGQMAVAEATGLIKEIDRLVLRQALGVLRRLDSRLFMSVNVSVRSLVDPSYLEFVEKSVHDADVEPSRVRLEVTESTALAVPPSVRSAMERLVKAGFTWYMDDFGTGYSSLASLRDLPMGGLKLDRSFTATLSANRDRVRNLTQGLARLAADMGLITVAEGVETREEADLLAAQGWKFGQGWLYGRAMSAHDAQLLATGETTLPTVPASG